VTPPPPRGASSCERVIAKCKVRLVSEGEGPPTQLSDLALGSGVHLLDLLRGGQAFFTRQAEPQKRAADG
jgi:hypothetical protein